MYSITNSSKRTNNSFKCFVGLTFVLLLIVLSANGMILEVKEVVNLDQKFTIRFDKEAYSEREEVVIHGSFSMYVNCGSQYAVWGQFPEGVYYTLEDFDSGITYESMSGELSISWDGNQVYEQYANMPCNRVVKEPYSIALKDVIFSKLTNNAIKNFKLSAHYLSTKSNELTFVNTPLSEALR